MDESEQLWRDKIRKTVDAVNASGHPFAGLFSTTAPGGPLAELRDTLTRTVKQTSRAHLVEFEGLVSELTGDAWMRVNNKTSIRLDYMPYERGLLRVRAKKIMDTMRKSEDGAYYAPLLDAVAEGFALMDKPALRLV